MSNIKKQGKSAITSAKRVVNNGEQFIQAVSLLVVAVFSYSQLHNHSFHVAVYWVVTTSLVIIGLRGAYELVRFLDKD